MFKEYFKELKNLEVYEEENGFILFRIDGNTLYVRDVYVKPEVRRTRQAFDMVDKVIAAAKDVGCEFVMCDVEPSNRNATASIKFILAYNCEVVQANDDEILFLKRI